jgi:hypothetical protein
LTEDQHSHTPASAYPARYIEPNKKQEDGQAISDALELAKARRILLTADWAVTPEEKQLARKVIDRLTHNAAKKGFKGQ